MLLAASVPLSKIINSTFGSGELKGFDESLSDKIYDGIAQLFPQNTLVESDNILCIYPKTEWFDPTGIAPGLEYMTNKAFRFSHSGRARFKMTMGILARKTKYSVYLCDSSGNELQEVKITVGSPTREVVVSFDVQENTDYKLHFSIHDLGSGYTTIVYPELKICADFSDRVSQINYV